MKSEGVRMTRQIVKGLKAGKRRKMEGDRERENVRGGREGGKSETENHERSIILPDIIESFTPPVIMLNLILIMSG